jgi:hypothetical protein
VTTVAVSPVPPPIGSPVCDHDAISAMTAGATTAPELCDAEGYMILLDWLYSKKEVERRI